MAYFAAGNFDLAVKYLEIARRIDPAHFSHPQLVLAEIHLRRGENSAAADALEDFLRRHPDYPTAEKIRENIARLRN
jgi:regulator of sirC expression with transglutaminase-like and TPR domain